MAPSAAGIVAGILLSLAISASAQIRVLSPQILVNSFKETKGRITGSTATFGAPFYGDKVLGRLVWGKSDKGHNHCREDDYEVPQPETETHGESTWQEVRLINIVMVRRGLCSFTKKVEIAYAKGAHAVIIVDKIDSTLTSKDMHRIIVADDGFGDKIHIPSILISKQDGEKLIEQATSATPVIVELAWDIPTDHVVVMDLWMSSASKESLKFLKEFSAKRKTLNEVVKFQPHYAVFGMPKSDPAVYNELCSDTTGEYCAEDPDGNGAITGKMVLDEDIRQLCIHELTKVPRTSDASLKAGKVIDYAEKYWDYVSQLMDSCPLDAPNIQDRFGQECSERLQHKVGLNVEDVQKCVRDSGTKKLNFERENAAWSPRALRINGWRYSGMLDADLVTRAICAGFIEQPSECTALLHPRDPFIPYIGAPAAPGVSFRTFVTVLVVAISIALAVALLYKRSLKQSVRTTLREEVMLEVQAQMGEYKRMQQC